MRAARVCVPHHIFLSAAGAGGFNPPRPGPGAFVIPRIPMGKGLQLIGFVMATGGAATTHGRLRLIELLFGWFVFAAGLLAYDRRSDSGDVGTDRASIR